MREGIIKTLHGVATSRRSVLNSMETAGGRHRSTRELPVRDHVAARDDVQRFWEAYPLSWTKIRFVPGTKEFFREHAALRERDEPAERWRQLYEPDSQRNKLLLDVGCGNGFVTLLYARRGARVVAIDVTQTALCLTRQRLKFAGVDAKLVRADAEQLPFRAEVFDTVSAFGVLHHTSDMAASFSEVQRVLKRRGRLLLMIYHRSSVAFHVLFRLKRLLRHKPDRGSLDDEVRRVDGWRIPSVAHSADRKSPACYPISRGLSIRLSYSRFGSAGYRDGLSGRSPSVGDGSCTFVARRKITVERSGNVFTITQLPLARTERRCSCRDQISRDMKSLQSPHPMPWNMRFICSARFGVGTCSSSARVKGWRL
jgi:SAM-dependent methyltransferase